MTYYLTNHITNRQLTLTTWSDVQHAIARISQALTACGVPHIASKSYGWIVDSKAYLIVDTVILPQDS